MERHDILRGSQLAGGGASTERGGSEVSTGRGAAGMAWDGVAIRKQKQFRSTTKDLLTTLFCLSFYASPPDRSLTTDPAGGNEPGGND